MTISANILPGPGARLKKERDKLIDAFPARGVPADFTRRHSGLVDEYFVDWFENSRVGPRMGFHTNPYAMIALGGYGRREQCLHSDIDILLLFEKAVPRASKDLIREVLYPLWDLGFEVGHATRSVKECRQLAGSDPQVLTALLDGRFLCGMSALYDRLREHLRKLLFGNRGNRIIAGLIDSNHDRHRRFGDSSYLLEPNLKEGQGGLRDYHTILWIAKIQSSLTCRRDLEYFGYLTRQELEKLETALAFILNVRNHLHHLARRKFDQLYFEHQKSLAARLKYKPTRNQLPVERFLGKLHEHMGFLKKINLMFLEEMAPLSRPKLQKTRRCDGMNGLWIENNRLSFASTRRIIDCPRLLFEIFLESARRKMALSWEARRVAAEFAYLVDRDFRRDPETVKLFEQILKTPAGPFNVLDEMLETGILERFIPVIKSVKDRIQFDGYHLYPIDRHLLRCVKAMKDFASSTPPNP